MKKKHQETTPSVTRSLFAFLLVAVALGAAAVAPIVSRSTAQSVAPATTSATSATTSKDPKLVYPESKKVDQVDEYFGTKVADPYRWLEDDKNPEVQAWIEAQNKVTFAYLDRIPYREKLKARLTELYNYPRISAPFRRGDTYFFTKNDGLQNQSVYLHPERRGRQTRRLSRSEQVLRRRHFRPERVFAFERRQVSRLRHLDRAALTG